jgi:hypothetical protein
MGPNEIPQLPGEIVKRIMMKRGRKADVATVMIIAERKKSLDVTEISIRRMILAVGKMMADAKKGWPLGNETNPARIMLWRLPPIDAGLPQMIVTDDTNARQLVSESLDILGTKVRRKRIVRIGSERRRKSPLGWTPTSPLILHLVFLVDKYLVENSTAFRHGKRVSKTKKYRTMRIALPMDKAKFSDSLHPPHLLTRPRKRWTKSNYSSS